MSSCWDFDGVDRSPLVWTSLDDLVWAEFGGNDDHIVPEPGCDAHSAWLSNGECGEVVDLKSAPRVDAAQQDLTMDSLLGCDFEPLVGELKAPLLRTETWSRLTNSVKSANGSPSSCYTTVPSITFSSDQLSAVPCNASSPGAKADKVDMPTIMHDHDLGVSLPHSKYQCDLPSTTAGSYHLSVTEINESSRCENALAGMPQADQRGSLIDHVWEHIDDLEDITNLFRNRDSLFEEIAHGIDSSFTWTTPSEARDGLSLTEFPQGTSDIVGWTEEDIAFPVSRSENIEEESATAYQFTERNNQKQVEQGCAQIVKQNGSKEKQEKHVSHRKMQHKLSCINIKSAGSTVQNFTSLETSMMSVKMQQPLPSASSSFPMLLTQPSRSCSRENYHVLHMHPDISFNSTGPRTTSQLLPSVGPNPVPQPKIMLTGYEQYSLQQPLDEIQQQQKLLAFPVGKRFDTIANNTDTNAQWQIDLLHYWHQNAHINSTFEQFNPGTSIFGDEMHKFQKLPSQQQCRNHVQRTQQHLHLQKQDTTEIASSIKSTSVSYISPQATAPSVRSEYQQESGFRESSLEVVLLKQLETIVSQLDMRTRVCIRDALYRLAQSAMERHTMGEALRNTKVVPELGAGLELSDTNIPYSNRCSRPVRFSMGETETNPIDRSIADLLFSKKFSYRTSGAVSYANPHLISGSQIQWQNLDSHWHTNERVPCHVGTHNQSLSTSTEMGKVQSFPVVCRTPGDPTVILDSQSSGRTLSNLNPSLTSFDPGSPGGTAVHRTSPKGNLLYSGQANAEIHPPIAAQVGCINHQEERWSSQGKDLLLFGDYIQDLEGYFGDLNDGIQYSTFKHKDRSTTEQGPRMTLDSMQLDETTYFQEFFSSQHQDGVSSIINQNIHAM